MSYSKILKYLKNPVFLFYNYISTHPQYVRDDEKFLKMKFNMCFGYPLHLDNPITFNEKLQWLKLYYRKPELTQLVDKVAVKDFVAQKIGDQYIIPTIGVWEKFDDIDWNILPDKFVLKTNHDSGGFVICKDKSKLNRNTAKRKIEYALSHDNYSITREWPYKNVKRKILCEQYMEDESGQLKDYKFFCFDGEPKLMFIASNRIGKKETKFDYFDMDFNRLPIRQSHPNSNEPISKPLCFELMKELAHKLSDGLPHARIDFYQVYGRVYFGEITLFHYGGFTPFIPESWDEVLGGWLNLPPNKITENNY